MLTSKTLATLRGFSERTARRRLAAMRDAGEAVAVPTGRRGRPPLVAAPEVLAERTGLTPEDFAA